MEEPQHSVVPPYDPNDEYRPEPPPPPQNPPWMDGSIRIGIHTSIAQDIVASLDRAHRLGANALQIFSSSPRMWARAPGGNRITEAEGKRFRERRKALCLGPVVIHVNYLINLASPQPVLRTRSIQSFHEEIVRALALGGDYLVSHPGSGCGADARDAVQAIAAGLRQASRSLKLNGLRILLENTAGQGSSVGSRFEELEAILDACSDLPLGICLDTAHLFEAGLDLRRPEGLQKALEAIDRTVGLERVFVVHVNDSKTPLGSRVDRHQHIGRGQIGLDAFRRILSHPLLAGRAFILETPIDRPGDDRRNVRTLWKLVGRDIRPLRSARDGFRPRRRAAGRKPSAKWRSRRAKGGSRRALKSRKNSR